MVDVVNKGWSGKVEQTFKGKPVETTYHVEGKKVATVRRGGDGGGRSATVTPGVKEATLQFGDTESVVIKPTVISTTTQEYLRQSYRSPEAQDFIKTYSARTPTAQEILTPTQKTLRVSKLTPNITQASPYNYPTRSSAIYEPSLPTEKKEGFVDVATTITPYVIAARNVIGRVGDVPFPKFKVTNISPEIGIDVKRSTLGKEVERARDLLRKTGEKSAEGWEVGAELMGVKTESITPGYKVPVYQQVSMVGEPGKYETPTVVDVPESVGKTIPGMIPGLARVAPEVVSYLVAPTVTIAADVISSAEKSKRINEDVRTQTNVAYEQHLKEDVPEDYRHLTKSEFRQEYSQEIRDQIEKQNLIGFGTSLAFLGGVGAFKAYKAVTRPKISFFQAEPTAVTLEVKQPIITSAGKIDLSTYKTYQYRPPLKAKVTTPFRETFKMKPKIDWTPITKSQTYISEPFGKIPVIGDQPHIARIAKIGKGGKLGEPKYSIVGGDQSALTLEEYMKLPKVEQYRLQKLIETTKTGGRPVKIKDVPKYLKESEQLVVGDMKVFDIAKAPGRQTSSYGVTSTVEPLKEIGGARFFKTEVAVKSTTKPFSRAAGRVQVVPGRLVELPPITIGKPSEVNYITPGDITKTPLSKTFQLQVPKVVSRALPIPKSKIPKAFTDVVKRTELPITIPKPFMVGGTGIKEIPYSGTGSYEGYFFSEISPTKVPAKLSPTYVSDVRITPKVIDVIKVDVKEISKLKERSRGRIKFVEDTDLKEISVLKPSIKEKTTTIQKTRLRQKEILKFRLEPKLKLKSTFRPVQPKPTPLRKPTYTYIPKLDEVKKRKFKLPKKKKKELLTPYVKRRGKWFAVSKPTTKKEALRKGITKLRGTLAASLQLRKKSGGVVQFGKETQEFRFGKKGKETFTLVQRAPKRLSARQEVSEIIASRRAGGTRFL